MIATASVSTNSKKKVPDKVLNVALVTCLTSITEKIILGQMDSQSQLNNSNQTYTRPWSCSVEKILTGK